MIVIFEIKMDKISAVVITYNASATIGNCIDALKIVSDEVIVIDSFSTDTTPAICKQKEVIFYQQQWLGYGAQKNFGISKASNNYILSIDADEIISEKLAASIMREKQTGLNGHYSLLRINYYYFKFLKYGGSKPSYKVRIFNKQAAVWDDREVHEDLITEKKIIIKKLDGYLLHYSYDSISQHLEKLNNYTTLGAKEGLKKKKKHFMAKMIFSPLINFFTNYFIRLGFLDGFHGYVVARFSAYEKFVKYAKLWEMQVSEKGRAANNIDI